MRKIGPAVRTTIISDDGHDWHPQDFPSFLIELKHIVGSCVGDDPAPLFRGQSNHGWLLDCTFVRSFVRTIFSIENYQTLNRQVRRSILFHKSVLSLLLLKFGVLSTPSQEAFEKEKSEGVDPWYEFIKHSQQYPESDSFVKGTFVLDWTTSSDIALYFANQGRSGAGAVWICDSAETGKTLQVKRMGEVLELMHLKNLSDTPQGVPLIFHPTVQALHPRAAAQFPVYIAQMDYRCDLADAWFTQEAALVESQIFVKLVLPEETQDECTEYLTGKGITREVVYPE